jgi:hypothetical protein
MKRSGLIGALFVIILAAPVSAQAPVVVPPPPVAPAPVTPPPAEPTPPCIVTATDADSNQGITFFLGGDYLFVKPRRRLQDFVIVDPFSDGRVAGTIESVDWGWRSAFRIGGGVQLAYGLEVAFYYTYLHAASQSGIVAPDGGTLFATLTHPGTVDQVNSAFAATSFNYNLYDLEVGKTFKLSDCFGMRLFGGSRSARIDQNFNVLYDGNTANKDFVASQVRFNGGGARLGLEGIWHPGDGWGLYGRAAASLVLGDFKTHLSEVNNAGTTLLVDVTERFDKVLPVLELGFGVTYQYRGWRITAGYEYTNWFGLADLPDFVDDFHQGKFTHRVSDVSIDGLVVRIEYRY